MYDIAISSISSIRATQFFTLAGYMVYTRYRRARNLTTKQELKLYLHSVCTRYLDKIVVSWVSYRGHYGVTGGRHGRGNI